ncbi:rhoptry associated membrane antigen [Schistosoma japonicum]|nr:rhoptry associated membrane antigen [Schistosoma japonicum]
MTICFYQIISSSVISPKENQHKSKSITSILSKKNKHHHKQDLIVKPTVNGNKSKNKGKSLLCGCVSRKSKKR